MRQFNLSRLVVPLLFVLSQVGVVAPAAADSPTVGRNFRFNMSQGDQLVVTLTEDLPVTSADLYFDIKIDGGIYGWDVVEGQRVYPIDTRFLPESSNPWEIRLGIYGTVSLNGVDLDTIDGDVLAGLQAVNMVLTGPNSNRVMSVQGWVVADPIIFDGLWVTAEYIPTDFNGMSQAEIDAVTAAFAAMRQPEIVYGSASFEQQSLALPCTSGNFMIHPKASLGPDHFAEGAAQAVSCTPTPEVRVIALGGSEVVDGGAFAFPATPVSSLPVSRQFNVCNIGTANLTLTNPASLVGGSGFVQGGSAPSASVAPGACTALRVDFNATAPGAYNGAITIENNDLDENPYHIALSGVAQAANQVVRVQSQTVTRQGSLFVRARDEVLVTDLNNQPVAGVLVTLVYSGPTQGSVSGTTGSNGRVTLQTNQALRPRGQWCFTVTSLSKSGAAYNPAMNVVTTRCG